MSQWTLLISGSSTLYRMTMLWSLRWAEILPVRSVILGHVTYVWWIVTNFGWSHFVVINGQIWHHQKFLMKQEIPPLNTMGTAWSPYTTNGHHNESILLITMTTAKSELLLITITKTTIMQVDVTMNINSTRPPDVFMHQQTRASLVQIMVCHLHRLHQATI